MDRHARSSGAAAQDLSRPLRQDATQEDVMTVPDEPRGKIFERIRAALGAERLDRARRSAVQRRLERHPRGPLPARATRQGEERVALFASMLAKQGADVRRVATPKEAVGAVASYLGTCNLPPRVRMGRDRALAGLPW